MIMPGVERVDTIKTDDGYEMKSIWCRSDLSGYFHAGSFPPLPDIYGYVQDLETGMRQYIMLDFETGETVYFQWMFPASLVTNKYGHRHVCRKQRGNALYCLTGYSGSC